MDPGAVRRRLSGALDGRDRGFTLIELMVVTLVIVVLAGIVLAQYGNTVTRSKEAVLAEDLFQMRKAIDEYYADKNKYPPSLDALVAERYIREIPVDPFTSSADTWQTETAEPDPRNPGAEIGIGDVKSGAQQTALDGTPYSEW
jgi:general secretion pathway protein G